VRRCFFASDLHGNVDRYRKLFVAIATERPQIVFLGGDLLPMPFDLGHADFVTGYLQSELHKLRGLLATDYPRILIILGNDDPRVEEAAVLNVAAQGLWTYVHDRRIVLGATPVYGYAFVPPSPFQLKDWERYDVSRYVDPGCVSPEECRRSVPVAPREIRYATIQEDLAKLTRGDDVSGAVFLFHAPPYQTKLDRAALDGKMIDHVPLDVHIGSIAIQRYIAERQPRLTLHGHVHESARLSGAWRDQIGRTTILSAAHDGPELALVRFDLAAPEGATRELI